MTKPFYAEYANHAMRFYARHNDSKPSKEQGSNLAMWEACETAMQRFTKEEVALLLAVYRSKCTIREAVTCISRELSVPENKVWRLINRCARSFASERGLI